MPRHLPSAVGERFGENGQVEAISYTGINQKWTVKCHTCADDWELYGDGVFTATLANLRKGHLPCGCAQNTVHNLDQHEVLISRYLEGGNKRFIKFIGEFKGVDTRLLIQCKIDGHEWEITIDNLMRGKGCPQCQANKASKNFTKSDEDIVEGFLRTEKFAEGTTFTRSSRKTTRGYKIWWNVYCPICKDTFESRMGNLGQGHLPCNCPNSGFSKKDDSFVYVLRAVSDNSQFTGYGISGNIETRFRTHRRKLLAAGFTLTECETFSMIGEDAQKVEQLIRKAFEVFPQKVEGFKTEATKYHLYDDVIQFIENFIKESYE